MKLTRYDEHILQYDDVCTDDDSNNIIEWCHKHRYRGYGGDEDIASMEKTSIRHNKSYDITKTLHSTNDEEVRSDLEKADTLCNEIFSKVYQSYQQDAKLYQYYTLNVNITTLGSDYVYRCYDGNEKEHYNWHVDRDIRQDLIVSHLLYLNDDFVGGDTKFLIQRLRVKPKKNSMIVFPCGPGFIHKGTPVTSGYKKIIWSCFFKV